MDNFLEIKPQRLSNLLSLTDTSTLWSIDSIYRDIVDSRGVDCLIKLVNSLIDPRNETKCLFQNGSLIDYNQKVPNSYSILKIAGLIVPEKKETAKDYESILTYETLFDLLITMSKWVSVQAGYATEFKNLHRNCLVKDDVRYKQLSEDGRSDAIPPIIYEFCNSKGLDIVQQIQKIIGQNGIYWSENDVQFVFAIIARGVQYECAVNSAYSGEASYLTHPVRLLPACNGFILQKKQGELSIELNIGSKIISAWLETTKDFNVLVEWINKVKTAGNKHISFFEGKVVNQKDVNEVLWDILKDVPPRIQDKVIKLMDESAMAAIGGGVGELIGGLPGAIIGGPFALFIRFMINSRIENLVKFRIPSKVTRLPLIRKIAYYPNYSTNAENIYSKCPRCGTQNLLVKCPVCDINKAEVYEN